MYFEKSIKLTKDTKLPLWGENGDNRKVMVPAGTYRIKGTDGYFNSRIVVEGISVKYRH